MKKYLLVLLLVLLFISPALSQTAEEYYNRAVNKYFLGDNDGAINDLNESLRLDPGFQKSTDLMSEIKKDTAPTPPPAPAPAPQVEKPKPELRIPQLNLRPAPKVKEEVKKPETKVPVFTPQRMPQVTPIPQSLIQQLLFWMLVVSILIVLLVIRLFYVNLKEAIERRKYQVCTECKWSNPGESEFCSKCGARLKPWTGVSAAQRKWYSKLGWKRNPFTLDIMPDLFTGYQTQVEAILEKIHSRAGHILIFGNKGVGKTTLLKWLTDKLKDEFMTIYIPRPTENFDELLEFMADHFKLKKPKDRHLTIYDIEEMVSKTHKNLLVLLDEAHEFTEGFERPLRTLGDINGIKFVLGGLPEVREKIKKVSPPFYDRIVLEEKLEHLTPEETHNLIQKRIESVGGSGIVPFTHEAIENIFKMSQGIPRMLLKVCDWIITDAIRHDLYVIGSVPEAAAAPEEAIKGEEKK